MLSCCENARSEPLQASYTVCGGQNALCKCSSSQAYSLRWRKRTIRTSASFLNTLRGENALYEPLQASYTIYGGENALYAPLQGAYTICGGQNALSKGLQAF